MSAQIHKVEANEDVAGLAETRARVRGTNINRHSPDGIRIGANRRQTPPPMEEISLCGHPTAPI